MCLFNSLLTSLVNNKPLLTYCCKVIVFLITVWERCTLVIRCNTLCCAPDVKLR